MQCVAFRLKQLKSNEIICIIQIYNVDEHFLKFIVFKLVLFGIGLAYYGRKI